MDPWTLTALTLALASPVSRALQSAPKDGTPPAPSTVHQAEAPVHDTGPSDEPPDAKVLPCPNDGPHLHSPHDFGHWDAVWSKVAIGWTLQKLKRKAGPPSRCSADTWTYVAGSPDGPEITYYFTIKDGKVSHIQRSAVACRYNL